MHSEKLDDLQSNVVDDLKAKVNALQEHAEHFTAQHIEKMKEREEAFELSEDEIRLLKAYRGFVSRSRPGSVFSWETPKEANIVTPSEVSLVHDPRDVSQV